MGSFAASLANFLQKAWREVVAKPSGIGGGVTLLRLVGHGRQQRHLEAVSSDNAFCPTCLRVGQTLATNCFLQHLSEKLKHPRAGLTFSHQPVKTAVFGEGPKCRLGFPSNIVAKPTTMRLEKPSTTTMLRCFPCIEKESVGEKRSSFRERHYIMLTSLKSVTLGSFGRCLIG